MSEELLRDIAARLDAIGEKVSEERIKGIVAGLLEDKEFSRKMRFAGPEPALVAASSPAGD
jgi:hypothetical protein